MPRNTNSLSLSLLHTHTHTHKHTRTHTYPTHLHKQDVTQDQFLSRVEQDWDFHLLDCCHTKVKETSLPNYLPIARGRIVRFISLPRVLALCEKPTASFWSGTLIAMPISMKITILPRAQQNYIYNRIMLFYQTILSSRWGRQRWSDWLGLKEHIHTDKTYAVHSIGFQTFFFVQAFKIVVDSWKFTMLLLYILWDDWPIFMISYSKEQLQQQLGYTLLKPDCHSWGISKMQSAREDTLEERDAIKFCFKLRKKCHRKVWNASDCFSTILHEWSISFWVAKEIQGSQGACAGWWEVWEE